MLLDDLNSLDDVLAFADKSLIIDNPYLGYRIHYELVNFRVDFFKLSIIDSFGNYSNIDSIIFTGNLSERRTADLLPLDYDIE